MLMCELLRCSDIAAHSQDFLLGGHDGKGTCCKYDEEVSSDTL